MRTAWLVVICVVFSAASAVAGEQPSGEGRLVSRVDGKLVDVPL